MNPRNVAALAVLLHEIVPPNTARLGTVMLPKGPVEECDFCQDTARKLSAQGVLVPSALTDDAANEVGRTQVHPVMTGNWDRDNAEAVRAELERIAKGEG